MPPPKQFLILILSSVLLPFSIEALSFNSSRLAGIIFPIPLSFNSAVADPPEYRIPSDASPVKLHLKHRPPPPHKTKKASLLDSARKDSLRIQALFRRATRNQKQSSVGSSASGYGGQRLSATVESGVALGSGEYFIEVFIGTPPQHYSLILDTGSDLNWLQCRPCLSCFEQSGPIFDPSSSSSYRNLSCADPRCSLVTPPETSPPCQTHLPSPPCPYFYWYGDHSNTTGDLATEVFSVNLTGGDSRSRMHQVEGVIFGCGHWNRGLFHGAAGLLGLGRGPLSFASQLGSSLFSYCLVDRNSDLSVTSKLILGEDPSLLSHPALSFTSLKQNLETFYYLSVKGVKVGGQLLDIPAEAWDAGGTIIDSGTTLSYFADPVYQAIRQAVEDRVPYPAFRGFPVLSPCYNVSGISDLRLPGLSVAFSDGAVWDFPAENCFIRLDPEPVMCLAVLGSPASSLSILGNYQQQNFHILYDTQNSRLGFAPVKCANL